MKKSLCVFAVLAFSFCLIRVNAENEDPNAFNIGEGESRCGEFVYWSLNGGVLTIRGKEEMYDFKERQTPWYGNRTSITKIVIEEGVTYIGDYAFSYCSQATQVVIPYSVYFIGHGSFSHSGLQSVTIPSSVTSMEDCVFASCTSLVKVTIEPGLTQIREEVFSSCTSLKEVTIPSSVKTIGDFAFFDCKSLQIIIIPDSVVSIGSAAFESCTSLKLLSMSYSVRSIGGSSFESCTNLTSLTIPSSATTIGGYAFFNCKKLTNVAIYGSDTTIGSRTFGNCSSLSRVILSDGVRSVGDNAFEFCSSLLSVTIPSSVASIGSKAFYQSGLESVFYEGSNTSISIPSDAFQDAVVKLVCVPPDYESDKFGSLDVSSQNPNCTAFRNEFNHCYEGTYVDGEVGSRKRKNATLYESQTNGCIEYYCDNENGEMTRDLCNDTNGVTQTCVNNNICVVSDKPAISVDIELNPKTVRITEFNATDILLYLSKKYGGKTDLMKIGFDTDDEGYVVRIVVIVDDKETAESIAAGIDEDDCYGVLCKKKKVTVHVTLDDISSSWSFEATIVFFMTLTIMLMR